MARLMPETHAMGTVPDVQMNKITALLLLAAQQAAAPGGGSTPPTTGQLWPRGNS